MITSQYLVKCCRLYLLPWQTRSHYKEYNIHCHWRWCRLLSSAPFGVFPGSLETKKVPEAISEFGIQGLQETKSREDDGMHVRQTRMWKSLGFVLIDFDEECFSLLTLLHLCKNHVFVKYSMILLNITAKITSRYKV